MKEICRVNEMQFIFEAIFFIEIGVFVVFFQIRFDAKCEGGAGAERRYFLSF